MGLEAIRDRIVADAQKEAAEIAVRSKEETRLILDEAEKEAEKIASLQSELAKAQAEKAASQILSSAKLDARMRILEEKRSGIERVFEQAAKEFSEMKTSERMATIEKLMSGIELPEGKYEMDCAEGDIENLDKKRLEEFSKLPGAGVLIEKGKPVPIIGGFILRSESVDYDFSIDSLMRSMRGEIEKEIVKPLFSE